MTGPNIPCFSIGLMLLFWAEEYPVRCLSNTYTKYIIPNPLDSVFNAKTVLIIQQKKNKKIAYPSWQSLQFQFVRELLRNKVEANAHKILFFSISEVQTYNQLCPSLQFLYSKMIVHITLGFHSLGNVSLLI